jgi:hypothetical protein
MTQRGVKERWEHDFYVKSELLKFLISNIVNIEVLQKRDPEAMGQDDDERSRAEET